MHKKYIKDHDDAIPHQRHKSCHKAEKFSTSANIREIHVGHGDCEHNHSHKHHHKKHHHKNVIEEKHKEKGNPTIIFLHPNENVKKVSKDHGRKRHHSAHSTENSHEIPLHRTKTFLIETNHRSKHLKERVKENYTKHRSRRDKKSQEDNKTLSQIWYCQVETNSPFKQHKKLEMDELELKKRRKERSTSHPKDIKEKATSSRKTHDQVARTSSPNKSKMYYLKDPKLSVVTKAMLERKELEYLNKERHKEKDVIKPKINKQAQHKLENTEVDKKIEDSMKMYYTKLQNLIDKKLDALLYVKAEVTDNKRERKMQTDRRNGHYGKNTDQETKKHNDASHSRKQRHEHICIDDQGITKPVENIKKYIQILPQSDHHKQIRYHNNPMTINDHPSCSNAKHINRCHVQMQEDFTQTDKNIVTKLKTEKSASRNKASPEEYKDIYKKVIKGNIIGGPSTAVMYVKPSIPTTDGINLPFYNHSSKFTNTINVKSKNTERQFWVKAIEPTKKDTIIRKKAASNKTFSIAAISSQMNDRRSNLYQAPKQKIVKKKDRLTRFKFYYQYAMKNKQRRSSQSDAVKQQIPSESYEHFSDEKSLRKSLTAKVRDGDSVYDLIDSIVSIKLDDDIVYTKSQENDKSKVKHRRKSKSPLSKDIGLTSKSDINMQSNNITERNGNTTEQNKTNLSVENFHLEFYDNINLLKRTNVQIIQFLQKMYYCSPLTTKRMSKNKNIKTKNDSEIFGDINLTSKRTNDFHCEARREDLLETKFQKNRLYKQRENAVENESTENDNNDNESTIDFLQTKKHINIFVDVLSTDQNKTLKTDNTPLMPNTTSILPEIPTMSPELEDEVKQTIVPNPEKIAQSSTGKKVDDEVSTAALKRNKAKLLDDDNKNNKKSCKTPSPLDFYKYYQNCIVLAKLQKSQSEIYFNRPGLEGSTFCQDPSGSQPTDGSQANANSLLNEHIYNSTLMFTKDFRTSDLGSYQKRKNYDATIRNKMKKRADFQNAQWRRVFHIRYNELDENLEKSGPDQHKDEQFRQLTDQESEKFLDLLKTENNAAYSDLIEFLTKIFERPDSHQHTFDIKNKCTDCDTGKNFFNFSIYLCNSMKCKCCSCKTSEEEFEQPGTSPTKSDSREYILHKEGKNIPQFTKDTSATKIIPLKKYPHHKSCPAFKTINSLFDISTNLIDKNNILHDGYRSETSGYDSSKSKQSLAFLQLLQRSKTITVLKPQPEKNNFCTEKSSINEVTQEGNCDQKITDKSEPNCEFANEPCKETEKKISNLSLKLIESMPITTVQKKINVKKCASDTNFYSIKKKQTTNETDFQMNFSYSCTSLEPFANESEECVSFSEKVIRPNIYVTNTNSYSMTLAGSNLSKKSTESNQLADQDNSINILITRIFFENILEMYENESIFNSELLRDEDFVKNQLLSSIKKLKKNKKEKRVFCSRIKAVLKNFFFGKHNVNLEEDLVPQNNEKSITLDNEYQKKIQMLAGSAHKNFSILVEMMAFNYKMDDELKRYGILRLLEAIKNRNFEFLKKFTLEEGVILEKEIKNEVKQVFIDVYLSAQDVATACCRKLSSNDMNLMTTFVCKYRVGLMSKTDVVAAYLGKGYFKTEHQLKAAVTYLLKTPEDINLQDFEEFCRNHFIDC